LLGDRNVNCEPCLRCLDTLGSPTSNINVPLEMLVDTVGSNAQVVQAIRLNNTQPWACMDRVLIRELCTVDIAFSEYPLPTFDMRLDIRRDVRRMPRTTQSKVNLADIQSSGYGGARQHRTVTREFSSVAQRHAAKSRTSPSQAWIGIECSQAVDLAASSKSYAEWDKCVRAILHLAEQPPIRPEQEPG
jgi:hypothetical protein